MDEHEQKTDQYWPGDASSFLTKQVLFFLDKTCFSMPVPPIFSGEPESTNTVRSKTEKSFSVSKQTLQDDQPRMIPQTFFENYI